MAWRLIAPEKMLNRILCPHCSFMSELNIRDYEQKICDLQNWLRYVQVQSCNDGILFYRIPVVRQLL